MLSLCSTQILVEQRAPDSSLPFESVPAPANNDAATHGKFVLVTGERDRNGGTPTVLQDGLLPLEEDQPSANFFFRAGSDGGRLQLDLGRIIAVAKINTYSRHTDTRAPQVYQLYGADGTAEGFTALPGADADPESCGWEQLAAVDTRSSGGADGGRHRVSIFNPDQLSLGRYRYLLFAISPTETRDPFGNTFFSEIDVIDSNGPPLTRIATDDRQPVLLRFTADGANYQFTIDATLAPDLVEWADAELRPVVQEWYPKLVAMLPSDGFVAATNVTLRFRNDMGGTPASAGGNRINLNSEWFRRELNREARGSVVHEMVHVVQNYRSSRRTHPNAVRTPGWLVEGMADYIRWFLYEPETHGAEITERNFARARYDASYRITGNFLNWVTQQYDQELIRKLNVVAREGRYQEELWKEWTGLTLAELGQAWKQENATRLGR